MITATATPEAIATTDWQIEPAGFMSRNFNLFCQGELVTRINFTFWREGCTFSIAGHDFAIRRQSMWSDAFQLLAEGNILCDVKRSLWSRRFELSAAEQRWLLQPVGVFSTTYLLLAGKQEQGCISRVHWWSQRRVAEFASDVPPPIQVLAIFLVLLVGKRQSKAN